MSINAKWIKVTSFYNELCISWFNFCEVYQNDWCYEGTLNTSVSCRNSSFNLCMTISLFFLMSINSCSRHYFHEPIIYYTPRYNLMHYSLVNHRNNTDFLICASNDFVYYPCRCPCNRSPAKIAPLSLPLGWLEDYMNKQVSISIVHGKCNICAFHEQIHAVEDWIFVKLSSLVFASDWTTNRKKFAV